MSKPPNRHCSCASMQSRDTAPSASSVVRRRRVKNEHETGLAEHRQCTPAGLSSLPADARVGLAACARPRVSQRTGHHTSTSWRRAATCRHLWHSRQCRQLRGACRGTRPLVVPALRTGLAAGACTWFMQHRGSNSARQETLQRVKPVPAAATRSTLKVNANYARNECRAL